MRECVMTERTKVAEIHGRWLVYHGEAHPLPYPLWKMTRHYLSVLIQNKWPIALMSALPGTMRKST